MQFSFFLQKNFAPSIEIFDACICVPISMIHNRYINILRLATRLQGSVIILPCLTIWTNLSETLSSACNLVSRRTGNPGKCSSPSRTRMKTLKVFIVAMRPTQLGPASIMSPSRFYVSENSPGDLSSLFVCSNGFENCTS